MENNNNPKNDHRMCDWCGNEYGRKYRWWRLILAILIGLFIFLAGIEIGQMRMANYGIGGHMMHRHMYNGGYGMDDQEYGPQGTTTIVVPSNQTAPAGAMTNVNPGGPMIPATGTTTPTAQ